MQEFRLNSIKSTLDFLFDPSNGYVPIGWRYSFGQYKAKEFFFINNQGNKFLWVPHALITKTYNNKNMFNNWCRINNCIIDQATEDDFPKEYSNYRHHNSLLYAPTANEIKQPPDTAESQAATSSAQLDQHEQLAQRANPILYGTICTEKQEKNLGAAFLDSVNELSIEPAKIPFEDELQELWDVVFVTEPERVEQETPARSTHAFKWLQTRFAQEKHRYSAYFSNASTLAQTGMPSIEFWRQHLTEINLIIKWLESRVRNVAKSRFRAKHALVGAIPAVKNFCTKVTMFLNYCIVSFKLTTIPNKMKDFMTLIQVTRYMNALSDPEQFGHSNPQTIRGYIDVLVTIMKFASYNNVFEVQEVQTVNELSKVIRACYNDWGQKRDQQLQLRHSASNLQAQGLFISIDDWVEFFQNLVANCNCWIYYYNNTDLDDDEKEEYIFKYGKFYMEAFLVLFSCLTFFNRPEVYYQGDIDFLQLYEMKPPNATPFYQYAYVYKGPEKVSRTIDTSSFAFGEHWNAIIYFFKRIIHPGLQKPDRPITSLFINRMHNPLQRSKADGYTDVVKNVSLAYTGVKYNSQQLRFNGNAKLKQDLKLTPAEHVTLDTATNHTSITAGKYYKYTGLHHTISKHGSSIINKLLNYNEQVPEKIIDQVHAKLSTNLKGAWMEILKAIPDLDALVKKHDSEIDVMTVVEENETTQQQAQQQQMKEQTVIDCDDMDEE